MTLNVLIWQLTNLANYKRLHIETLFTTILQPGGYVKYCIQ